MALFIFDQAVIYLRRIAAGFLCAAGVVCAIAPAQTPAINSANGVLPPNLAALLPVQSQWSVSAITEASYGYKDNLLLSQSGEERSAFARGSVSFMLLRASTGPFEYSLLAEADGTHYFSGQTVDHDASAWVLTEFGWRLGETLRLALPVTGYYSDQVFDQSDTAVERLVVEQKFAGITIGPTLRWTFLPAWWIEAQASGDRKRFAGGSYDGRVGEGALRLGWKATRQIEFRIAGMKRWRDFDRRTQYTAAGRELADTALKIAEKEIEGRADVAWDAAAHWRTVTRVNARDYRDNGPGYFNFREKKVGHELEWQGQDWLVRLSGRARRVDFRVQTVGFGIDPPARIRDEYNAELHVERKLGKHWTAFAEYTWERSRSNDAIASYIVNEGLLGLRWSWEK